MTKEIDVMNDIKISQSLPIEVSLIVSTHNNHPMLELRRVTSAPEIIKLILTAAFQNKTLVMQPVFTRPMQSVNSLVKVGILYQKDDKFYFNI
jgi:hypothetical protein